MEGSRELRSLLLSSGCATKSTTPVFVRELFKSLASRRGGGADSTVSLCSGNPEARKNCILLLHYCLADLGSNPAGRKVRGASRGAMNNAVGSRYKLLAGLPFVPLADGSHGFFRSVLAVDATKLKTLQRMGFSEGRSRQALVRHKDLQVAVEWLYSGGGGNHDSDPGGHLPFVLCAEEEAQLLAGAGKTLVNEASLTRTGSTTAGSAIIGAGGIQKTSVNDEYGADDGRVLRALRSPSLQAILNVTSMRDDLLPDLIGQTLPAEWRNGGATSGTAFSWTPGKEGHPTLDWFRGLWGYLASTRPTAVRLLAESYPVVPTGEAAVCPLSLRSAVIDGGHLSKDVRSIVIKAGCRTLLPGVFSGGVGDATHSVSITRAEEGKVAEGTLATGQNGNVTVASRRQLPPPPPELSEYVRPGTREGVLAALGTSQRSAGKTLVKLMITANARERDALREFLAREPASEMSDVEVAVCRSLPILPLYEDGLAAARALEKATVIAKKTETGGGQAPLRVPGERESLPLASPGGGTYAAADAGPLYLLLEAGTGLVGVRQDGSGGILRDSTSPAAPSPQWLETHLFTPRFVKVGGSTAGRGGAAEAALLERLGADLIGRAVFFVDHVFPRLWELPAGLRNAAMVEAIVTAPRLSQQHQLFRSALAELKFVPVGSKVNECFELIFYRGRFRQSVECKI